VSRRGRGGACLATPQIARCAYSAIPTCSPTGPSERAGATASRTHPSYGALLTPHNLTSPWGSVPRLRDRARTATRGVAAEALSRDLVLRPVSPRYGWGGVCRPRSVIAALTGPRIDPAHHAFKLLGGRRLRHIQVNFCVPETKGSGWNLPRIPLP
jgi:hypothetical protein